MLNPPSVIDGQKVVPLRLGANDGKPQHGGDTWPKVDGKPGPGQCLCVNTQATNGRFPYEVGAIATAGGQGNILCNAVKTDESAPSGDDWKPGPIAHTPESECLVYFRNCDLTGGKHPVHFPPKHPPKVDTDTSFKIYNRN